MITNSNFSPRHGWLSSHGAGKNFWPVIERGLSISQYRFEHICNSLSSFLAPCQATTKVISLKHKNLHNEKINYNKVLVSTFVPSSCSCPFLSLLSPVPCPCPCPCLCPALALLLPLLAPHRNNPDHRVLVKLRFAVHNTLGLRLLNHKSIIHLPNKACIEDTQDFYWENWFFSVMLD